ncbi:F-type H+-transporting ATPase subunit alpha [Fistulifera solaris]|jgi:F0F1-type ATP synthase alpha subunit|uniref:F-type H+-transporting ATPase subunit alpha n=1 Tax=Fistulifera solaris TaxID=1519565 RepID=A0A1Z5JNY7_FISSO|nr:F-type H+-transporting ATPase subunit alpha [Fistulifera solaris]|eukprot:GAX15727.1 F-type H+-transporting ATPase subunit alpha [Fistulifera solaris]
MRPLRFSYKHISARLDSMRLRYSLLPAALAVFPPPAMGWTQFSITARHSSSLASVVSVNALKATVDTLDEVVPALMQKDETPIARGTVVANFPGGFAAIKLDDGDDEAKLTAPEVIDLTNSAAAVAAAKAAASESGSSYGDLQGKRVQFSHGSSGVVVCHRPPIAFVLAADETSAEHMENAQIFRDMTNVSVFDKACIVDCFGKAIDSAVKQGSMERPIFAPIPQVKDIALINSPMLTGTTMIDSLAPIGRGQNMLFVTSDRESAQGYAMDLMRTQLRNGGSTKCVYAITDGQENILQQLEKHGIADKVTVIVPNSRGGKSETAQAAEAVTMAATACAIGEAFALEEGAHSLVIIDTIDQHKKLWDATTRTLVDVFGLEAVVEGDRNGGASSEMRSFYSSLIQRSAQYKASRGGGSVTLLLLTTVPEPSVDENTVYDESLFEGSPAKILERINLLTKRGIPLTAANLRKIDIPIPSTAEGARRFALQHVDDLISMSDGQIWMDDRLKGKQEPPLDPQRSVTRIGIGADTDSRADAPALRRVVEGLRLDLSQAANMDGAEATAASKKQIQRQQSLILAMYQKPGSGGRRLSESCVALLAAYNGFLNDSIENGAVSGSTAGLQLMEDLLRYVGTKEAKCMDEIDQSMDLSAESRDKLAKAIESFFDK